MQEIPVWLVGQEDPLEKGPAPVFMGFPGGSDDKESTCNMGDLGSIPELGRSPRGRHGNPLQYFCLENPHGQRNLEGYSPWGCKELDMTERLSTTKMHRERSKKKLYYNTKIDYDQMEGLSTILAPSSSFNDFQILCYNSSCLLSMGMPGTKEDSLCLLSLIPKIDGKLSFVSTKKK